MPVSFEYTESDPDELPIKLSTGFLQRYRAVASRLNPPYSIYAGLLSSIKSKEIIKIQDVIPTEGAWGLTLRNGGILSSLGPAAFKGGKSISS